MYIIGTSNSVGIRHLFSLKCSFIPSLKVLLSFHLFKSRNLDVTFDFPFQSPSTSVLSKVLKVLPSKYSYLVFSVPTTTPQSVSSLSLALKVLQFLFFPLCNLFYTQQPFFETYIWPNFSPIKNHLIILKPSYTVGVGSGRAGYKLVQPLQETVRRFLSKLKIKLPYDPAVPFLGIYLKLTQYFFVCLFKVWVIYSFVLFLAYNIVIQPQSSCSFGYLSLTYYGPLQDIEYSFL